MLGEATSKGSTAVSMKYRITPALQISLLLPAEQMLVCTWSIGGAVSCGKTIQKHSLCV